MAYFCIDAYSSDLINDKTVRSGVGRENHEKS